MSRRLYTEEEAPRGTPLQALAGWGIALLVGAAVWAGLAWAVAEATWGLG